MGKEVARESWGSKIEFILSAVGYSVSIGGFWRFPYLCYRNGGGAFLIPYVIMLLITGLPMFFLELALGQFSSEGPIRLWKICPLFYGIGWGMVIINCLIGVYTSAILMYIVYYMFVSFVNLDGDVPWKYCDNPWNTESCRQDPYPDFSMLNKTSKVDELRKMMNNTCVNKSLTDMEVPTTVNSLYDLGFDYMNINMTNCLMDLKLPSEEYWTRFVLRVHESDGIDDISGMSLKNLLCLLFVWLVIFFCLMKGIKFTGKIVYFTATIPYVLLVALLVRGLTLPGFKQGIEFYVIPDWERLKESNVWADAATQIFYSLGLAFGALAYMSSYNKFKENCFRNSLIVAFINCGTSVFAGFVIFSLVGFMAHTMNQKVEDVVDKGPGLAFIAYPEGLARLPMSSLWAFLFFVMLFALGLGNMIVSVGSTLYSIMDLWPHVTHKRKVFVFLACFVFFVLAIPMTTKGGILVLTLMDWYLGSFNIVIVGLCELLVIVYVYGFRKWMTDIEMMIGKRGIIFWSYYIPMWCFITPLCMIFIIVMSIAWYTPVSYDDDDVYPEWAQAIGWLLCMVPVACIVIGLVVGCIRYRGNLSAAIRPKPEWGPRLKVHRSGRYYGDNYGYEPDVEEEL